jgi:hypothetical protein
MISVQKPLWSPEIFCKAWPRKLFLIFRIVRPTCVEKLTPSRLHVHRRKTKSNTIKLSRQFNLIFTPYICWIKFNVFVCADGQSLCK